VTLTWTVGGTQRWAKQFAQHYSMLFDVPADELMQLTSEEMLEVMKHFGVLGLGETQQGAPPAVQAAPQPPAPPQVEPSAPFSSKSRARN
jgi:hypothetical protein